MIGLHTLDQPDRFGSWLTAIGLNVCRLWLRHGAREFTSWDALEHVRDTTSDPESRALLNDLATRVRTVVDSLPQGQRSAVNLFYLSDLSYAQTATALGIEVGAVRTRLHKARATLRHQLRGISQEDMFMEDEKNQLSCSFCGKRSQEVRRMIAGPKG